VAALQDSKADKTAVEELQQQQHAISKHLRWACGDLERSKFRMAIKPDQLRTIIAEADANYPPHKRLPLGYRTILPGLQAFLTAQQANVKLLNARAYHGTAKFRLQQQQGQQSPLEPCIWLAFQVEPCRHIDMWQIGKHLSDAFQFELTMPEKGLVDQGADQGRQADHGRSFDI